MLSMAAGKAGWMRMVGSEPARRRRRGERSDAQRAAGPKSVVEDGEDVEKLMPDASVLVRLLDDATVYRDCLPRLPRVKFTSSRSLRKRHDAEVRATEYDGHDGKFTIDSLPRDMALDSGRGKFVCICCR